MKPTATSPLPGADPSPDLTRLAGLKLGNYRLERLVGHGRMGAVYLARDEALLRPTAVKLLAWRTVDAHGQDPVQWFLAEARLVARINHPNVVQIYGAARQGEHCYIAMEYVPGRSAEAAVQQDGPLAPEVATDVLVQAASALAAAHRSGVIHRDVKPGNLLLGEGGVTKLGDFGMALGLAELRTPSAHLRVGTPYYTAPEIWRGEAAGAASDLYSLGATYFQLLTGRPPFPLREVAAVERAHREAPPPDPRALVPALPEACAALALRLLAKAPRDRHTSAQDLAWDGRRVLQELSAPRAGPGRRPAPAQPGDAAAGTPGAAPPWARALGLARPPFDALDPACPPYGGEPFAALHAALRSLAREGPPIVALTGAPGSGRTVLLRRLAAGLAGAGLVLFADLSAPAADRELLDHLRRLLGRAAARDAEATLEAVVEQLEAEGRRRGVLPLVLLDGLPAGAPPPQASRLLSAAAASRTFRVILAGAPGAADAWLPSGLGAELVVPPLDAAQLGALLEACLAAARAPGAAPLAVSPDALLLLAHRAEGSPGKAARLAENMLVLAAAHGRRTLTSFLAWAAPEHERWAGRAAAELPRPPTRWPSPEAVRLLDSLRVRAAGGAGAPRRSGVDLAKIAGLPNVRSVVLADRAGAVLDAVREVDGEGAAAVVGFLAAAMGQLGEDLGLGALQRLSTAGAARTSLLVVTGAGTLAATIEPASAAAAVERALDAALGG